MGWSKFYCLMCYWLTAFLGKKCRVIENDTLKDVISAKRCKRWFCMYARSDACHWNTWRKSHIQKIVFSRLDDPHLWSSVPDTSTGGKDGLSVLVHIIVSMQEFYCCCLSKSKVPFQSKSVFLLVPLLLVPDIPWCPEYCYGFVRPPPPFFFWSNANKRPQFTYSLQSLSFLNYWRTGMLVLWHL